MMLKSYDEMTADQKLAYKMGREAERARWDDPDEVRAAVVPLLDLEAALTEYLRLIWAHDGMGPYAEELADEILPNGVRVSRISNFEEAKRIVYAALGLGEES